MTRTEMKYAQGPSMLGLAIYPWRMKTYIQVAPRHQVESEWQKEWFLSEMYINAIGTPPKRIAHVLVVAAINL